MKKIRKLLIANRSEIAIRVMRAANELGIHTVGIYSNEDRFALHRFKADESYLVGNGKKPLQAYLDIDDIIRIARQAKVDAIHPGYGFLAENPDFSKACEDNGLVFIGPSFEVIRNLGDKVIARQIMNEAGISMVPGTSNLSHGEAGVAEAKAFAATYGYPVMLKATAGGGGRGIRRIDNESQLLQDIPSARAEAKAAFNNDSVYLIKPFNCVYYSFCGFARSFFCFCF